MSWPAVANNCPHWENFIHHIGPRCGWESSWANWKSKKYSFKYATVNQKKINKRERWLNSFWNDKFYSDKLSWVGYIHPE